MRTNFRSLRMLLSLALVVVAVTVVAAQTVANGPYYALPSWAQKLPSTTRFIVLANWNNEAVLDRETGLVWEREPPMTMHQWRAAVRLCPLGRVTGGRMGWRLPSIHELASLLDPSKVYPASALPDGHPFVNVDDVHAAYWSATSSASTDPVNDAWFVIPPNAAGFRVAIIEKTNPAIRVWCVRGPSNADAY
jgi:hypothetical protein